MSETVVDIPARVRLFARNTQRKMGDALLIELSEQAVEMLERETLKLLEELKVEGR